MHNNVYQMPLSVLFAEVVQSRIDPTAGGIAVQVLIAPIASTKPDLNLVLCGSDAALKASVLKCFMGKKTLSMSHQTFSSVCVMEEEKIHGHQISLVELPALTQLSEEEVMRQTLKCVSLCDPGVHVFLLIVPDAPLTDEDKAEIEKIQKIFDSREHFMLLFTTELTVGTLVTDLENSRHDSQNYWIILRT
ncbi:hypothetical protein cypCar_00044501 [Cyprinus carpio]|nr:hypothetical protein cypCar_00044501 [Cyprinus carpio]